MESNCRNNVTSKKNWAFKHESPCKIKEGPFIKVKFKRRPVIISRDKEPFRIFRVFVFGFPTN